MYKEDMDISQAIKQEIGKIVDQWVNDLVKEKIATPQINPNYQRGLWDRLKGSLSNLWYGRYNQDNPNYWKNRFGDDLGTKEESFDISVFTLSDYKEIKCAIEETEKVINENTSPDVEKLRIVKVIKSAAEDLKQKLFSIFVRSCSGGQGAEGEGEPEAKSQDNNAPPEPADGVTQADRRPTLAPSSADASHFDDEAGDSDSSQPKLEKRDYIAYLPKMDNKKKSLQDLMNSNQLVDTILHKEFESVVDDYKAYKEGVMEALSKLKHDAELNKENKRTINAIDSAIEKFGVLTAEEQENK